VLKNSSGIEKEMFVSNTFHSVGIPLLVSPNLLRQRGLGQIDLARLVKTPTSWQLDVVEVKSSILKSPFKNKKQYQRLNHSTHFLALIFGAESKLHFISLN
jgi:hypothetical protein